MKARFDLAGHHEIVVVLEPQNDEERLLLASFIRYDANSFTVSVDRRDDGKIETLRVEASQAR